MTHSWGVSPLPTVNEGKSTTINVPLYIVRHFNWKDVKGTKQNGAIKIFFKYSPKNQNDGLKRFRWISTQKMDAKATVFEFYQKSSCKIGFRSTIRALK